MIIDSNLLNSLNNQISQIMEAPSSCQSKDKVVLHRGISEMTPQKDAAMLKIEDDIREGIGKMIALKTGQVIDE